MFRVLLVEGFVSIGMLIFFLISMGILLFLVIKYNCFIKDAENMSITKRRELKAIKTKFLNSYGKKETKEEHVNVEVFVDKAVSKLKFNGLKIHTWRFFSGQSLLVSIFFAGLGAFRGIMEEMTIREISPFYLIAFLELYIFFSVVSICDFEGKEKLLRLTIIEYIENHMINRIRVAKAFQTEEKVLQILEEEQRKKAVFSKEMEEELDSLLQEYCI